MPIVASEIVEDAPQADGRRYIRERHTDHLGVAHEALWLAAADEDAAAVMAARVPIIEAELQAAEIAESVSEVTGG